MRREYLGTALSRLGHRGGCFGGRRKSESIDRINNFVDLCGKLRPYRKCFSQ